MKEAEQKAEARGLFAFRALFLIGPKEGPVRIGVSKQPMDQLRLMNRHCLLTSYIGYEGYSSTSGPAQRVMTVVLEQAKRRGLLHPDPRKADTIMLQMSAAIDAVEKIREHLGIVFSSKEDKRQAIIALVDDAITNSVRDLESDPSRKLTKRDLAAKKKPGGGAWL